MPVAAAPTASAPWPIVDGLWRCVDCSGSLLAVEGGAGCVGCGRRYPVRDGVLVVDDQQDGYNKVVRDFYDGPLWPKFRFWEWATFASNGGERRSRNKVLKHLPAGDNLQLLDVAIGDGVYLPWLPESWGVVGVDISTCQLDACRRRGRGASIPLVLGEAEDLPFQDDQFDAALSIGGFNYFNDPEGALREMARVVRPGGTIVVSDEVPNLADHAKFGRLIGLPGIDRWMVKKVTKNLGEGFNAIVDEQHDLDVRAIGERVLGDCRFELIWRKVGYVMVGTAP